MALKSSGYFLLILAISLVFVACSSSLPETEAAPEPSPTITPFDPAAADAVPTMPTATAEPVPAPGFTLASLSGEEISLSDYSGEWLIVNFWATWCPPCVYEMPYLQSLSDRGLNVLGINMAETAPEVRQFIADYDIDFPILMEPDINTILDYQARQLPRTVIVAPDGNIALRISGPIDGEQLDPWLAQHGVK